MRAKASASYFVALYGKELNMHPLSIRQPNAPWFEGLTMTAFFVILTFTVLRNFTTRNDVAEKAT
jgi:phage terminase large subunit-like protein